MCIEQKGRTFLAFVRTVKNSIRPKKVYQKYSLFLFSYAKTEKVTKVQRVLKRDHESRVFSHAFFSAHHEFNKILYFSKPFFGLMEFFSVSADYRHFTKSGNESQYINTVSNNFCYMSSFTEQDTEFRFYTIS